MTAPTPLRAVAPVAVSEKAHPEIVDMFERALAAARAGEITAALLLTHDADGLTYEVSNIESRWTVLGYLSHAMAKLNKA